MGIIFSSNKKGNRIHDHAVNNVLRRLNGIRNEKDAFGITVRPRGNHATKKKYNQFADKNKKREALIFRLP